MPLLVVNQRCPEWYEARRGRITASLAAAVLGKDPHKGPLAAFNEIVGMKEQAVNKHMAWGVEFEKNAQEWYEIETGNLFTPTGFWVHPSYDWLGASPDGMVGGDGLLEVKCPGEPAREVPGHHLVQMAVQMAVLDRAWCDYVSWTMHKGVFSARVVRDAKAEAELLRRLSEWHEKHIVTGKAPPRRKAKVA